MDKYWWKYIEKSLLLRSYKSIIQIIKQSANVPEAKEALRAKPLKLKEHAMLKRLLPEEFVNEKSTQDQFLSGPQADAILSMQLQRLTGLEVEKLAKEYAALSEEIAGYEAIPAPFKGLKRMNALPALGKDV